MQITEDQIKIIDEISWVSNIYFKGKTYEEAKMFIDQNFNYLGTKVKEAICDRPIKPIRIPNDELVFSCHVAEEISYEDFYNDYDMLPGNPDDFGHN